MDSEGPGAVAPRGIAENDLKLSLSMGEENARNSKGFQRKMKDSGNPGGLEHGANSEKMTLSSPYDCQKIPE